MYIHSVPCEVDIYSRRRVRGDSGIGVCVSMYDEEECRLYVCVSDVRYTHIYSYIYTYMFIRIRHTVYRIRFYMSDSVTGESQNVGESLSMSDLQCWYSPQQELFHPAITSPGIADA